MDFFDEFSASLLNKIMNFFKKKNTYIYIHMYIEQLYIFCCIFHIFLYSSCLQVSCCFSDYVKHFKQNKFFKAT